MSNSANTQTVPRAMVHKRILDTAVDEPTASLTEIAGRIPGATTDLVDRVLDEYGDPADEASDVTSETPDPSMAQKTVLPQKDDPLEDMSGESPPVASELDVESNIPDEFSEKQYETLCAIYEHPEKSQRELADVLGISGATVSNRVKDIEGFDWAHREEFVTDLFRPSEDANPEDSDPDVAETKRSDNSDSTPMASQNEVSDSIDELTAAVGALDEKIDRVADGDAHADDTGTACSPLCEPELAHKVVHACVKSENITEEEELRILQGIFQT